jgi:hypothetical protein
MSSSFSLGDTIREANSEAVKRILKADPVLVDVVTASEAIPDLEEGMILHAGPPIDWDRMCGPMRGAVAGIAVFEGWAEDLSEAEHLAEFGAFKNCDASDCSSHWSAHAIPVNRWTGMKNHTLLKVRNCLTCRNHINKYWVSFKYPFYCFRIGFTYGISERKR